MGTPQHGKGISSKRYVAWLDAGTAAAPVRCSVENVSRSGARLNLFDSPVPEEFTLCFGRKGNAKVRCRVVSCASPQCDIQFIASLEGYN